MADLTDAQDRGESRRQFIKKLAYMAPVMETFLLKDSARGQDAEEAESQADQEGKKKKKPKPSKPKPKPRDEDED